MTATASPNMYIPRPDKFSGESDIAIWFRQFELFLQISEVAEETKRKNILLAYLDLSVFQATVTVKDITTDLKNGRILCAESCCNVLPPKKDRLFSARSCCNGQHHLCKGWRNVLHLKKLVQ